MSVLEVREVCKVFGERRVLDGACLTVESGDTVAIMGPSGSGKSTLLNIMGGLDTPTSGTVAFGGTNLADLAPAETAAYRASHVGFVFQEHHLLPQLTAIENVLLPTLAARADRSEERALSLLEQVGVAHRRDGFPWQMSGGERQRVAVARALINRPAVLLCDEPTGNLDRETGSQIVDLLLRVAADQASDARMAVVMVTHNAEHAARFARNYRLDAGVLVAGT